MATAHEGTGLSSDEALGRLIEGNQRFLRGEARRSAFRQETLTTSPVTEKQHLKNGQAVYIFSINDSWLLPVLTLEDAKPGGGVFGARARAERSVFEA